MRRSSLALAILIAAGAIGTAAVPASAGGFNPAPRQATSPHNQEPTKSVTVSCPEFTYVYAIGGRINGGHGNVMLTAAEPDDSMSTATVSAKARPEFARDWSVTAYVICDSSAHAPDRVVTSAASDSVTAACPDGKQVFGLGFRIHEPVKGVSLKEVAPDAGLRRVRVSTGGDQPAQLSAIAICYTPIQVERRETSTTLNGTWPRTATIGDPAGPLKVYGVGARVQGPGNVFIDGLMLDVDANGGGARATLARSADDAMRANGDGDDGDVTTYAIYSGTFH